MGIIFISRMGFEQLIATVRWTVACRQLDGGNTLISIPTGMEMQANPSIQSNSKRPAHKDRSFYHFSAQGILLETAFAMILTMRYSRYPVINPAELRIKSSISDTRS